MLLTGLADRVLARGFPCGSCGQRGRGRIGRFSCFTCASPSARTNGTPERDGTRRRYGLKVPADISDPVEAVEPRSPIHTGFRTSPGTAPVPSAPVQGA